jgi:hypothetical protein
MMQNELERNEEGENGLVREREMHSMAPAVQDAEQVNIFKKLSKTS